MIQDDRGSEYKCHPRGQFGGQYVRGHGYLRCPERGEALWLPPAASVGANFWDLALLITASVWAAKASLISIRSASANFRPVSFSAAAMAKAGPRPIREGSQPA